MKNYLILGASSVIANYFITRLKNERNIISTLSSDNGAKRAYDTNYIKHKISETKPEVIISFVGSYEKHYSISYNTNVIVAKNLFDASIETNSDGRIILLGSAAEYGFQNNYTESCTEKPQSIYGLTKLMQHSLFQYYTNAFQIKTNYIRLFNVVSTNLTDRLFVGTFSNQVMLCLKGKTKTIELGNLTSNRDFLLIDDVYDGIMRIIEEGDNGEDYNVGMGKAILLREFVQKVLLSLDLRVKLITKRLNSVGNIENEVVADISKIKRIGWSPKFTYDMLIEEYCRRLKRVLLNENKI